MKRLLFQIVLVLIPNIIVIATIAFRKHITLFKPRTWAIIIAMIALFANLFLIAYRAPYKTSRDFENGQIARSMLTGHGYSAGIGWLTPQGEPTAHKPPLYPLFLAGVFSFFHDEWTPLFPDSGFTKAHLTVMLIQAIVYSLLIVLLFFLGIRLIGYMPSIAAALVLALSPTILIWVGNIERNTFDLFLLPLLLLAVLKMADKPTIRSAFYIGLISIVIVLMNSSMILAVFAVFCVILFVYLAQQSIQFKVKWVLLFSFIFIAGLSPWIVRNYEVFHRFVPLSSNTGLELWIGNNENSAGGIIGIDPQKPASVPPESLVQSLSTLSEPDRGKAFGKLAVIEMKKNKLRTVKLRFLSFVQFWFEDRAHFIKKNIMEILLFIIHPDTLWVLLSWVALLYLCKKKKYPHLMIVMVFIGLMIPYVITHGSSRYKFPLNSLIILYATYVMYVFWKLIFDILKFFPEKNQKQISK